jgi:hypothetical protein
MADGVTVESELSPEQRVDAATKSAGCGQIGLGSLGVGEWFDGGGGGAGGQFVFADLAALDTAIARWTALKDRIGGRGRKIARARDRCNPPAEDVMSRRQADAAREAMNKKLLHNDAMRAYADAYLHKLADSRATMAAAEQSNTHRLRNTGGNLGHA